VSLDLKIKAKGLCGKLSKAIARKSKKPSELEPYWLQL
jgi:hypothetical protein